MKLNKINLQLLMIVAVLLTVSVSGIAREIRVFPVIADPSGTCAAAVLGVAGGPCDLVRALGGFAPISGPDAGITPGAGDTIVVAPGTYFLRPKTAGPASAADGTGPLVIPGSLAVGGCAGGVNCFGSIMESLTVRSRDGHEVTVIDGTFLAGGAGFHAVIIAANNVTFGGDQADQGFTIQNNPSPFLAGVWIGNPAGLGNPYGIGNVLAPQPQASEDITFQHNLVVGSGAEGVVVGFLGAAIAAIGRPIENFKFLDNNFRTNGSTGLLIANSVFEVGGASEDEGVFILRNIFDGNGQFGAGGFAPPHRDGIGIEPRGSIEQLVIQENYIVRNGDNGISFGLGQSAGFVGPPTTEIQDTLIKANIIMENGTADNNPTTVGPQMTTFGAGIVFANGGQLEDVYIVDNRNKEFDEGITGNSGPGILFASAIAFPVVPRINFAINPGVQDLDNVEISNNVINANGHVTVNPIPAAGLGGLGGPLPSTPFDGISILNAGDLEEVTINYNNIRLNGGSGVSIGLGGNFFGAGAGYGGFAQPGDYDNNLVRGNYFWNNGAGTGSGNLLGSIFPYGDGFAVYSASDINNPIFEDNEAKENLVNGIFLSSVGNDITGARFFNNKLNKNGVLLGTLAAVAAFVPPTSDGLELSAFGDINDFIWDGGEANDNGGIGVLLDANANTLASLGYGSAAPAIANSAALAVRNLGDLDDALITNATFNTNGSSAPIGRGSGIIAESDKMARVNVNTIEAHTNDDHGVQFKSIDDMDEVTVRDANFSANDFNRDSVGSGVYFDSGDDMNNSGATNVVSNGNHRGITFDIKGQNGRELFARDNTANNNDEEGVRVNGLDDLNTIELTGNTLMHNDIGITVRSVDRGFGILIDSNTIGGNRASNPEKGMGIHLSSPGVTVTNNSIRDHKVGMMVERSADTVINNNNIARNDGYGIDGLSLLPGDILDATNNWWGEPSGPAGFLNPNGLGDEVTDKVSFEPWLGEPAVPTDVNFQIVEMVVPEVVTVGETANISVTVRNNGTEEGAQSFSLKVECGEFIDSNSITRTLNPATEVQVDFNVAFPRGGSCTVTVSTGNDEQTATITVQGATGVTIESVCDANNNSRIDDDEIMVCVGFWVTGEEVPGTGQSISDSKIKFLIELWVTNGDVTTLPANTN